MKDFKTNYLAWLFLAAIFLSLSACRRPDAQSLNVADQPVDLVKMAIDYQEGFSQIINQTDFNSLDSLKIQRDKLLALTVPSQFKEIHLQAVITLDQIIAAQPDQFEAMAKTGQHNLQNLLNAAAAIK